MSTEQLNAYLYRSIKSGKEYDKLIPKTACNVAYPFQDRNTTEVMELMKEISTKFSLQTKRLATVLKANQLETTVKNIYNFLHDHLQYKADGFEQNVSSPACSWKQRKTGVDCKSFSVFASSILINLGIPHVYRKVVQPNSPGKWSHVYVVIPYKNKTLIIDGTTHDNKEVVYTKKHDMDARLPARGLNGGMSQPQTEMTNAVKGFMTFLKELQELGVPVVVTNTIKGKIKSLIDQGIDPKIDFTNDSIIINGQKIKLISALEGTQGLGFAGAAVAVATKISALKAFGSKIGGLFSGIFGGKSSLSDYTRGAVTFINEIVPQIQQKHQADASALLTELSKSANFMLLIYEYARQDSRKHRSKVGNDEAIKIMKDFIVSLSEIEKELSTNYTIEKKIIRHSYPRNYIAKYATASPNLIKNYTEYKVTPKSVVQNVIKTGKDYYNNVVAGNNNNVDAIDKSGNPVLRSKSNMVKNVAIGAGVLTAAFLVVRLTPTK